MRVIGYVRVSTGEQAESGAGMEAQRRAIRAAAEQRGWTLTAIFEDAGLSASSLDRLGLADALATLETGKPADRPSGLMVAKLDRLSRSLVDFAGLMARSHRKGWAIVALDLQVDTSTPGGEMMAHVLATYAQFERRMIGQRTKDALAIKKSQGVVLGRRRDLADDVVARIVAERRAGATLDAIADGLNTDSVPTARGGARWYGSTVRAVLAYADPS